LWGIEWPHAGEAWSAGWGTAEAQWNFSIRPRIARFLPAGTVLEIATGYGRWTHFLLRECSQFTGIDLSPSAIEACRKRFPDVQFHLTDGMQLAATPNSVDFVFSFDSLVHVDASVMAAYIAEIDRCLRADGIAFMHHSNLGAVSGTDLSPQDRDPSVSADLVAQFAQQNSLHAITQEMINWGNQSHLIDCMTTLTRGGSRYDRPTVRIENPNFMREMELIQHVSAGY
jgi:SAM-dependent methyltransferase